MARGKRDAMSDRFTGWVERYISAWNSNDPDEIASLFSEEATYLTEPFAGPWIGRERIVQGWLEHKDEPGDGAFDYEILVARGELGIVKGITRYKTTGAEYHNLWEVRLDDEDRCTEFVEWWMEAKR